MGVVGMCEGEQRIIITPSEMAFGCAGLEPVIPPDTPIEWHTQLLRIIPSEEVF